MCSVRGYGYIEKILKIWSGRGILFAEVVLGATKRINDWRLLSMLQAKN